MKRLIAFLTLKLLMIAYVGFMFYSSEPKFINNSNYKEVEVYDYISIPKYCYGDESECGVDNGMVIQRDSSKVLVKLSSGRLLGSDEFRELSIGGGKYRIIGRGTFYHKVNNYIGFNIILITQVVIMILLIALFSTSYGLYKEVFNDYFNKSKSGVGLISNLTSIKSIEASG